jgi:UDP-N-acetylglucosamine 1-carboxyvinyltransferase
MDKFVVVGGKKLYGDMTLQGAKNVALKMFVASLLTDDNVTLHNIPRIRDVFIMLEVLKELGVDATFTEHTVKLRHIDKKKTVVPLEVGARLRTSSLVLGPLLARFGNAVIPNPGGCRLGARPIDRHILAIKTMGAVITYDSTDGYFYAKSSGLQGKTIAFEKNTHTGTEAVILAGVLAKGETIIKNAAQEVEIDDLIALLNQMGAKITRTDQKEIIITGVASLHGAEYTIMPDRNEEVTFAIAAAMTGGTITVHNSERGNLESFLKPFSQAGGIWEAIDNRTTRYSVGKAIYPSDIATGPHPGFMTDWQAPWAVFMTQASGVSTIHETVFESRFSYVHQLEKMGAHIEFFQPDVSNPQVLYNFNWEDRIEGAPQGIRIKGPTVLHNAVVDADDIRAGASVILAALSAPGTSYIYSAHTVDRGYEAIEERFQQLGADIQRITEDIV